MIKTRVWHIREPIWFYAKKLNCRGYISATRFDGKKQKETRRLAH